MVAINNDKTIIRNCVFNGSSTATHIPLVKQKTGLIYNTLFYGNQSDTIISADDNALVLNCTVVADEEGQIAIGTKTLQEHTIVNTITINEAEHNLGRAYYDAFFTCNTKLNMFAPYLRPTYTYPAGTPTNTLLATANQQLWYQLHENSSAIDAGIEVAWFGGSASNGNVNSRFANYAKHIDFNTDRDVLGNQRRFSTSIDLGCYETWAVTGTATASALTNSTYTTNYGGHGYPHAGSVVYINSDSYLNIELNDGVAEFTTTNPIRPAYLLLKDGASLYGNGNTIRADYVAVDKLFNNQQYSLNAFPYTYSIANAATYRYDNTKDSMSYVARDNGFDEYYYSGTDRATHNYVFRTEDSYCWIPISNKTINANDGWLLDFKTTHTLDTIRFTGWSTEENTWIYTEDGTPKTVVLEQYDNRTGGTNGSGLNFTRQEDMGWNMRGMPYLVAEYETGMKSGQYQMHIPHLIYQMAGTGDYIHEFIESVEQIHSQRSWTDDARH